MAPRNDHALPRGGHLPGRGGSERRNRNANTGAGINANHSTAGRDGNRARDANLRRFRRERVGDRIELARLTVGEERLCARGSIGLGAAARPQLQRGRAVELSDQIHHDGNDSGSGGEGMGVGVGVPQGRHFNNGAHVHSARMSIDDDDEEEDDEYEDDEDEGAEDNDGMYLNDIATDNLNTATQSSPLFCASQPTQVPSIPRAALTTYLPPKTPVRRAPTTPAIRMVNRPLDQTRISPKRPVNNYRGKDPIKKMVQNPKLRAILSGRAPPKARKKALDDRPDLRMGVSKITK